MLTPLQRAHTLPSNNNNNNIMSRPSQQQQQQQQNGDNDDNHDGIVDEATIPLVAPSENNNSSPSIKNKMGMAPSAVKSTPASSAALWFPALMVCSVGMVLLNKTLSVSFPHPNTVLGLQNGASVVYLYLGGTFGVFDLSVPFRPSQFKPFLLPTINWVVMLVLSLKMLQYNSVATMVMFKTCGTILTCAIETVVFHVRYSRKQKAALGVLLVGSAVYAGTDVGFSLEGYIWATLQISSWVLQTFIEKIATVDSEQTKTGVAIIRNVLSVPVVLVLVGVSGETLAIMELAHRREVWGQVALSSLLGCGLGLSTSALYKSFAPTTVVVANNVGKCISIVAGCFLFHDKLVWTQVVGLALSLAGSFWYGQEEKKRIAIEKEKQKARGHEV